MCGVMDHQQSGLHFDVRGNERFRDADIRIGESRKQTLYCNSFFAWLSVSKDATFIHFMSKCFIA